MIAKHSTSYITQNPYDQARFVARHQVAKQLEQVFGHDVENVRVFNDLRLEGTRRTYTFDHLIVHPYGAIIIENRSEVSRFKVSCLGNWTQNFMGKTLKIASPVEQLERKTAFLKKLLTQNANLIIEADGKKAMNLADFRIEGLVTLPLAEELEQSEALYIEQLCRRQFLIDRLSRILASQSKGKRSLFNLKGKKYLRDGELFRLSALLRQQHVDAPMSESAQPVSGTSQVCERCNSTQVYVKQGGGGHAFVCFDCAHEMPINQKCSNCHTRGQVTYSKGSFVFECENCRSSSVLYTQASERVRWL